MQRLRFACDLGRYINLYCIVCKRVSCPKLVRCQLLLKTCWLAWLLAGTDRNLWHHLTTSFVNSVNISGKISPHGSMYSALVWCKRHEQQQQLIDRTVIYCNFSPSPPTNTIMSSKECEEGYEGRLYTVSTKKRPP